MALQLSRESYFELSLATVKLAMPEQKANASWPMEVTEPGICMLVRLEHPRNALLPMEVMELGRITEVRPEQLQKAYSPIAVTLLGMVTLFNVEQLSNASLPMAVTVYVVPPMTKDSGITTSPEYSS